MNAFALSGLLGCITSLILCIFSWVKGTKFLNKLWAVFNLSVAIWGISAYKFSTTLDQPAVFFWLRFGHIGVIFIPVLFLHFVFEFLEIRKKSILYLAYAIGGMFFILNITDWLGVTKVFIVSLRYVFNSFYVDSPPGITYPFFVAFFFVIVIYAHYCGLKVFKVSKGIKRMQIKYFLSGMAISFGGGGTAFLMVFNIDAYPYLHFTVFLYPIILTYAIFKYRLMDINIAIGKGLTYLLSLTVVCLEMWALLLIINIFFNNIFTTKEFLIILSLTSIIYTTCIILYPKFLGKLETGIREFLYKDKYKYQDRLREVAGTIPTIYDMERLLKYTLDNTAGALDASPCSIMLMDDVTKIYSVNYSVGLKEDMAKGITLFHDTEIIQKLKWGNRILVREELTEDDPIRERMASIKAEVSIPIARKDKLLGVFNLNHKASGDIYSHEDLSILSDISKYLGMAIENISLGKEKERIAITKNRLDVTTSMAYGVADRIRNYIVPSATFFDLFPGRFEKISGKLTPEEKELVTSILKSGEESVQKTVKLARETADMCNPKFYKPEKYDPKVIMDLADKLTAELKSDMGNKEIKVTREITGSPPSTYFDKEAIKKILFHLVQNSIHAISEGREGIIAIKVTGPVAKSEKEYLRTTVGDTGCGIPKGNLDNIFNPFFTTKGTVGGTGLGLTICQFIISQHEGAIGVLDSELDKGTTMYFDLPIIKEPPKPAVDYKDILGQFPARRK